MTSSFSLGGASGGNVENPDTGAWVPFGFGWHGDVRFQLIAPSGAAYAGTLSTGIEDLDTCHLALVLIG